MINLFSQIIPGLQLPNSTTNTNPVEVAMDFMLQLAAALSVIYIIIAAIRLTSSSGDPQAIATGRKTIIFAVVGLIVSVMGLTLTSIVQGEAAQVAGSDEPFFGEGGILTAVIEKLSFAVGVAAVIMMIVGGIRYITSAGQPKSAESARNTIIYSVIGLIVAFIAQLLVIFVLNRI